MGLPAHPRVETEPMEDGSVLCPQCERPVGKTSDASSQFYCRHCKVDVIVPHDFAARLGQGAMKDEIVATTSKRGLLAMMAAANMRGMQNIASLMQQIEALPDGAPDNPL